MNDAVEIISLGGCGGFGMNATLFVAGDEGILVDFGTGFPHGLPAGVTRLAPDASPVVDRASLAAIVITHGHDDHAAALPYLPEAWSRKPVYGPPLALALIADRFEDHERPRPDLRPLLAGRRVELSKRFAVTPIAVTHSIPDSVVLAIETPAGLIVHTGDFRFDDAPLCGPKTDWSALKALGRADVRLLLCDSTGALREGEQPTEAEVRAELGRTMSGRQGQIVLSTFASQLHRLQAAIDLAPELGRKVACLSSRMARTIRHGQSMGLFRLPAGVLVDPDDLLDLHDRRRLWLAGGCQAETESSLNRLSFDQLTRVSIGSGDTVVVSASVIPGSEIAYSAMIDRFLRLDVEIEDALTRDALHASGHGSRNDIRRMIETVQPRAFVPMHGSRRHLQACLELAQRADPAPAEDALIEMGGRLRVDASGLRVLPSIEIYPQSFDDAGRRVPRETVLARRKLAETGVAIVVIHGSGGAVDVRVHGVGITELDGDPGFERDVREAVRHELSLRIAAEPLEERVSRRVGNMLRGGLRRRPSVVVLKRGSDA